MVSGGMAYEVSRHGGGILFEIFSVADLNHFRRVAGFMCPMRAGEHTGNRRALYY